MTNLLLGGLIITVAAAALLAERRHRELTLLLTDLATMVGEALDIREGENERTNHG